MRDADSSLIIRSRRMSKRLIHRESVHESDRQLKKLFRAIQDGDVNLVREERGRERGAVVKGWDRYRYVKGEGDEGG